VQLLDEIDPDPDLEDEHDAEPQGDEEPTMGWCNPTTGFLPGSVEDWTPDQRDPGMDQTSLQVGTSDRRARALIRMGRRDGPKPCADRLYRRE
jgi:hypothetical protein